MKRSLATLGGGCFWCVEAVLELLQGVEKVTSGYMGGHVPNPTYREVCSGTTGHAEVVQVEFDPEKLSFTDLVIAFMLSHDPTTLNRQGYDEGTQYRSVIFFHDAEQESQAKAIIAELEAKKIYPKPIVTEVSPAVLFTPAEDYHQGYYRGNPYQGYCQSVISPKVAKFRKTFLEKIKA